MRSMLGSLLVSVVGLALTGALLVAPTSALASRSARTPADSLLSGPLVAPSSDQLLLGEGARAARQARRSNPLAIAERSASRSKFESLSPARAASEAKSAFPALIEQPAGGVPVVGRGQRIVRYATNHAAEVSLPGGAKGMIESLAPIATTSGHRHLPVDLHLTDEGGRFRPVRSSVNIEIPRRLADGVSLANVGVSLTPVDRHGSPLAGSEGVLEGASVLWRHSDRAADAQDLASVAKASSEGFDLTTMLLSQRSPGKLHFRVGVPRGTHLSEAADGSVHILKGKAPLAVIAPVSAEDAEGTSVPVATSVHGHTLQLSVSKTGDYLYPIAVDPEINDSQLVETTAHKRSNWEFFTSNASRFGKAAVYEGPGVEHLETKGIAEYSPTEWAYWGYQTKGVSHIYELKTETSAKNKLAKIESFLEFLEPGGTRETKKILSTEFENPEYEKKATTICAANASKVEECLPASGKAKNSVHFQQSATGSPGANYKFSDTMSQGIASIAEPTGTHSTTSYDTTTPSFEFETEIEGKKEKITRANALYGTGSWLSKVGGALKLQAADTGIGVAKTKLEYESSPGTWTQLSEHNYLEVENACQGVQCYESHSEYQTLPTGLPDGEPKLRYKAEEAISGTQSLTSEGQTTVKVDAGKPHDLEIEGLPNGNELSEKPYELTGAATDGEGSTVASSGIQSIALFIDGHEFGTAGGSCSVAKGACTATTKWTVNGAELGSGEHDIEVVALDKAGNEARLYEPISIRHSTPVALGPGSVDLQSGDFALSAGDVSLGSGLTVGRNYSSRNVAQGSTGPLGPQWSLSLTSTESLLELVNGSILMTSGDGSQTIFAALGEGKFASPPGDSNLEMSLEENKETKEKLAYYLKNAAAGTSVKFTRPAGSSLWVPTKQEGTVASDTVAFTYQSVESYDEFATPSRPSEMVKGPDGNVWFTEDNNTIGKITPTGKITEYAIPGGGCPDGITVGPENNIWFVTWCSSKVVKMTMSGAFTEYSLPAGVEHTPDDITTGPDGNLWITEFKNKIGKVTPSGTVTEYALPTGSYPYSITEGRDGNLWFTEDGSGKVGKITTGGTITEYAAPTGAYPYDIAAGADGNLWFTERPGKKIGKITTTGAFTEYPISSEGETRDIATGPDGNLWFTKHEASTIGKITTSGTVTEYPIPNTTEGLVGITAGADGEMWFANSGGHGVGRMNTSGHIVEPVEELAPKPAGVSCEPELKAGCRALKFKYATSTTATGEGQSEWGEYKARLTEVLMKAYDPSSKAMHETAVAKYSYDKSGRLRAVWDPRISPNLKETYGYDDEGHVTAMADAGQEPWAFTYGAIAEDKGTGRLLKATRAPASTELWKGEQVANTEAPKITGTARTGMRLAVSKGTWSGSPVAYGYQWRRCSTQGACSPIPGATNANYTPQAGDIGYTLIASVVATNAGGSATASSAATAAVQGSPWAEYAIGAGASPKGMTKGPDGNFWFANFATSKIGKITTAGAVTEYALPAGSRPWAIVTGSDGKLWFTNNKTSKVGKITTSGTVTEYALPAGSSPNWIAAGPDGNLWFTNNGTSKIGKITTAGVITEYALPASSSPMGIAAGPDGNLWFTNFLTNKIGKITTAGVITEYALPAGSGPYAITAGPDGNLWYVNKASSKVGKITTAGVITEYALGAVSAEYIASASEALWVTGTGETNSKLRKVSTAGTITEYAMPAESSPRGVTAGSGEELWFAQSIEKVGKVLVNSLSEGEAKSPEPGMTLSYNVPASGTGAPHNMSAAEVAKWGQKDLPEEATAIFPMDSPQGWPASSYTRATVYYLDEQGRQVNVASPSTATYGSISTTEYNEFNDVIRTLTTDNRATALAAGASSVEKSKLLDTQSTYNGEGKKESEVEEAGTMLIDQVGPQHQIKYRAGNETKESLARDHKELAYDQGAPSGEAHHLLTESSDLAQLANKEEVEVRTTKTSYSGQSNLGWKLRAPTSVTVDPEGLKLTTTTLYDPTTGQITETRGAGAEQTFAAGSVIKDTSEAHRLSSAWGVAVNAEGNLWVVEKSNHVAEYTPEGTYITRFGETGSGPGQLKEPTGIALDSAGHIWIADTGNNRIEEFSSTGTYMASVGSLGSESGQFKAPTALAFDSKGNMWVADTGNSRVEKFDKEAKYVSEFGSLGSEPGKLKEPKGIAVDSGEHVWVSDTGNNRIQEFSTSGSLLRRFGSLGTGEGQLNTPLDLKIDSSGNIWAVDSLNYRAESFSPTGAYITQVGYKGTGTGQLNAPRSLAFEASGKLWVTDYAINSRLVSWSKGPNAHDSKAVYYSAEANSEYPACGSHPEWSGLVCETLSAKQPELMGLPPLPVTTFTYNMWNEAETTTETFGSTTRTKKETYDEAGRRKSSETTASTGTSLPKVNFTYNSEQGELEKQTTEGEGKVLSSEFNRLGQVIQYTDADGNVAKYKYAGLENDFMLEEMSDSSASGTSKQTYEYDSTTKLRKKLIDSAAGSFTASYDAEGSLTSVSYPYSMCVLYTHNSVGEATSVQYTKSSNCAEAEPAIWYSDTRASSVRGEMLSQSSTLAGESYTYDSVGRLSEAQETPTGEGCTVRAYAYDESGNRASSTSRTPGVGGACQTEGGTIEGHNYDEANRLADGGIAYDGLGNVTKLPAADAEGHELTSTYYVDNAVASQAQNGVTNSYAVDPEGRVRETTTGAVKTKSHYDGPGGAVAWTESAEQWVRNIAGIDGTLLATQTNGATPVLQLHDLQGNVTATIGDKAGEPKLLSSYNSTEFGVPNAGKAPPKFAWLGAAGVESALASGVVTYGSTSYVPQTGRALQSEAVEPPGLPGGSGAGAAYTMQEEAWNMQGAAAAGAEAPGLEAARERAAALAAAQQAGGVRQEIGGGGEFDISGGGGGATASVVGSPECKVKWRLAEVSEGVLYLEGGYKCKHKMPHMEIGLCLWHGLEGKRGAICVGQNGVGLKFEHSEEEEVGIRSGCTIGMNYTGSIYVRQWGPGGHTGWWAANIWERHHPWLTCESGYDGDESIGEGIA